MEGEELEMQKSEFNSIIKGPHKLSKEPHNPTKGLHKLSKEPHKQR